MGMACEGPFSSGACGAHRVDVESRLLVHVNDPIVAPRAAAVERAPVQRARLELAAVRALVVARHHDFEHLGPRPLGQTHRVVAHHLHLPPLARQARLLQHSKRRVDVRRDEIGREAPRHDAPVKLDVRRRDGRGVAGGVGVGVSLRQLRELLFDGHGVRADHTGVEHLPDQTHAEREERDSEQPRRVVQEALEGVGRARQVGQHHPLRIGANR